MKRFTELIVVAASICALSTHTAWAEDVDKGDIKCGETKSGAIGGGRRDIWTFSAEAGDRIVLACHETRGESQFTPRMDLYRVGSQAAETSAVEGMRSLVLQQGGAYKIVVYDRHLLFSGGYNITLLNLRLCANPIDCNETKSGSLTTADMDAYEFTAKAGDRIVLACHETRGESQFTPRMDLYRVGSEAAETPPIQGMTSLVVKDGTYKIVVYDAQLWFSGGYNITLLNLTECATPVDCNETKSGSLTTADMDAYEFTAKAGDRIVLACNRVSGESQFDPLMDLYRVGNNQAAEASAIQGMTSLVLQEDTYQIVVYDAQLWFSGGYNLTFDSSACEPAPDLVAGVVVDPNVIRQGDNAEICCTVRNDGDANAPPTQLRVYLSDDPDCPCNDPDSVERGTQIDGEQPVPALEPGGQVIVKLALASAAYKLGCYCVSVVVDPVPGERDPKNNVDCEIACVVPPSSLTICLPVGGHVARPGEGYTRPCYPGEIVPITAVPDGCYHFVHWTGKAVDLGRVLDPNDPNTTVLVDDAYTLCPKFEPNLVVLAIWPVGCGVVEPNEGNHEYECGTILPIKAFPCECHRFTHWSGTAVVAGDVNDPNSPDTTVTMNASYTLQADFELKQSTLTLMPGDGGRISISPDPCEIRDGNKYVYGCGTDVEITPVPEECYRFSKVPADAPQPTLCMDDDYTLKANFIRIKHTLKILPDPNGSVVVEPPDGPYDCGQQVKVRAVPKKYCAFSHWSGTAVDAGMVLPPDRPDPNVLMYGDYTLKANFACEQRTLDVSGAEGGYLNVMVVRDNRSTTWLGAGTYRFTRGTVVAVEATAEPGHEFTNWSGMIWSTDSGLVLILDEDCKLKANFQAIP
jgi:hypothetical protein